MPRKKDVSLERKKDFSLKSKKDVSPKNAYKEDISPKRSTHRKDVTPKKVQEKDTVDQADAKATRHSVSSSPSSKTQRGSSP